MYFSYSFDTLPILAPFNVLSLMKKKTTTKKIYFPRNIYSSMFRCFDQICKSVFNNFEVLLSKRKELKCKGVGSNLVPSAGEKNMEKN